MLYSGYMRRRQGLNLAICNEMFAETDFKEACFEISCAHWDAIEIAPFTLQEDATRLPKARRRELREIMIGHGLEFAGFHWLMTSPAGLHATAPDAATRQRSWEYVRGLIELCVDLREREEFGGVLVFGSPEQRRTVDGITPEQAEANFIEGVRSLVPDLEAAGVLFCIEALPSSQCDVIVTLDRAAEMVDEIGSVAVQTMFDTHNAVEEKEPHVDLFTKHFSKMRHIHLNELDGTHPRPGGYDFKPILQVAKDSAYLGLVSVEVFDFTPGPTKIIHESFPYLRQEIRELAY